MGVSVLEVSSHKAKQKLLTAPPQREVVSVYTIPTQNECLFVV